ncbi:hypothetical protein ABW19_dt0208866 [Dactylella cylindrospora]|nr:hypothetical protein ABW19_dt0208866 [Dactylella cylindrospora]
MILRKVIGAFFPWKGRRPPQALLVPSLVHNGMSEALFQNCILLRTRSCGQHLPVVRVGAPPAPQIYLHYTLPPREAQLTETRATISGGWKPRWKKPSLTVAC